MSRISHALYETLDGRLESFSAQVGAEIRAEAEGYRTMDASIHDRDVLVQIRAALDGLRAGRLPTDIDTALGADVGRRRATAGMPLTGVIDAYHIAFRAMWYELMAMAEAGAPGSVDDLARDAGLLWGWSHRLTAAVAEAHTREARVMATARASLRRRLLDALSGSAEDARDAEAVARQLGLDPAESFTVAVLDGLAETELEELAVSISSRLIPVVSCHNGRLAVLIAQGVDDRGLALSLRAHSARSEAGIGMTRTGLAGARFSLLDAVDAFRRSHGTGREVRFADDWLLSSLGSVSDRLEPLLGGAVIVAEQNRDWAETVLAHATHGLSAASAARHLHLHPNSVRYRLERWRDTTGWDPYQLVGLVASVVAVARADPRTKLSAGDAAPKR